MTPSITISIESNEQIPERDQLGIFISKNIIQAAGTKRAKQISMMTDAIASQMSVLRGLVVEDDPELINSINQTLAGLAQEGLAIKIIPNEGLAATPNSLH